MTEENARVCAFRIVLSGPAISTEHSSVLARVKIASQRKFHFGTQTAVGECSSQSLDERASNGCKTSEFTAYSLLFTVLFGG
ncbi:MAG: hypothetical protein DMG62_22900 [Acidobacteria bacterium]|nr:MAG: hypothetical protein DMG62_22900 [Acidobacteriota bacterium]